jgi:hypothetical protein
LDELRGGRWREVVNIRGKGDVEERKGEGKVSSKEAVASGEV